MPLNERINALSLRKIAGIIFLSTFLYCVGVSIFFQFVLLPGPFKGYQSSEHILEGIDTQRFHSDGIVLSGKIAEYGWAAWSPLYSFNAPSSLLGAIYYFSGPKIYAVIPLNAVLHGLAAVLLFLILFRAIGSKFGSLVGALTLSLAPSSVIWYAQFHRDGFAILGFYLIVFSLMWVDPLGNTTKRFLGLLALTFFGILLVWWMRPYMPMVFFLFFGLIFLGSLPFMFKGKCQSEFRRLGLLAALALAFSGLLYQTNLNRLWRVYVVADPSAEEEEPPPEEVSPIVDAVQRDWLNWLPLTLTRMRQQHFSRAEATTNLDFGKTFETMTDVLIFLPKATANAFFSPYPSQLFSAGLTGARTSLKKVMCLEMLVIYLAYLSLVFWGLKRLANGFQPQKLLLISLFFIGMLGLTIGNAGTLSRMRFPWIMIFVGWGYAELVVRLLAKRRKSA